MAGVFIWENFHPGYRDLGRKNRDLGNRASPVDRVHTKRTLEVKLGRELGIVLESMLQDLGVLFINLLFTNLLVLAVMLAISAKLVVIFPHVSVNISFQTSPHTFSNTY